MKESGINVTMFGSHSEPNEKMDGQMKKHLYSFMTGQFQRTFQTIYSDEICCFFYMYVYIWCYLYRKHSVNYSRNNTNQIEKNPGLITISSLILSNPHLYERTGN